MFKTKSFVKMALVPILSALLLAGCGGDKASTDSSKDVLAQIKEDKKNCIWRKT
jgi:putative glutamine transport system substrate-binding protein